MKVLKHVQDQMTPVERRKALEEGKACDRVPCVPFMGELKCQISQISVWDYWHDARKMADAEIIPYNLYGYDRMVLGPNSRGLTEALGGEFIYPKEGVPYIEEPYLKDYSLLGHMEPAEAKRNQRLKVFAQAAEILSQEAGDIVPIEASIGGPFTIASNLRGVEALLRDCRRCPEEVHKLLRIITESQKSCIAMASEFGLGIAMADPVANPSLIGPRMYGQFVYPYTKELTDYTWEKTGKKVSLHMCGKTYSIWEYFCRYELNEISLDNIIDLQRAVYELGASVPIAGNVDPVEVVMNGTREEVIGAVNKCKEIGAAAKKGYTLATGCDIPYTANPVQIEYFMDAARL